MDFVCQQCNKAFASAVALKMHCVRVHEPKETGTSDTMSLVDNTTRSTVDFVCQQCNKAFASAVALRMHCMRVHRHKETGASDTMSLVDNTTRSTDSSVRFQQPTDGDSAAVDLCGKKGLQCTFCMRFFPNERALRRHKQQNHNDAQQTAVTATVLPQSSTNFSISDVPALKLQCSDCGYRFKNLSNHKKCKKTLLKKAKVDEHVAVLSASDIESDASSYSDVSVKRKRLPLFAVSESGVGTDVGESTISSDHAQSSLVLTHQLSSPVKTRRAAGATRKHHAKLKLEAQLKQLKSSCVKKSRRKNSDPLLDKLTAYHNRLSLAADNILTEKLSAEIAEVLTDVSQVDNVNRGFQWSRGDEERLNRLNASAKQLQTPAEWTWAAKEGTEQYEYNHKRLQYLVEYELQTVVRHCDECKSTGILVGLEQIDLATCHDCCYHRKISRVKEREQQQAWESVRPKSMEYPKRTEHGHEAEDLPRLYPGDKAVIAPVHPVVTVRKNYMISKKLRQESITLLQDAQQTWCKVLPRTELKNRFVVIERTSRHHTRKHIVANPHSVAAWLRFLFTNHADFLQMQQDGELQLSDDALRVLQSQSELGEVVDDVEYDSDSSDSDDDVDESLQVPSSSGMPHMSHASDGIIQPALESGFCRTDVFTFDKFPHLYLKGQDLIKVRQSGEIEIIQDTSQRVPIYSVSATKAFPYLYPRGEKSPLDFTDYKMSRHLLKKQTLFAYKMADGKYNWEYAEDDTHLMFQYARLVEKTINASTIWYLQQTPDVAHLPMDVVVEAFKNGFTGCDESIIDSKMPGLASMMAQLPNSRESWFSERLGIEAMSRDLGDPNLFLTLSNDPRATYDTRALLYKLETGNDMPQDHPYERDTERFTDLMSRFAPQMSIYLCRKTKMFLKAFLCDICGIPERQPAGDWIARNRVHEGFYWCRVEFTETRGVQHWHCLAKLPYVLDTALLGRMIHNGRVVRQEIKCGNVKPGKEEQAWEIVENGLLASRYATLFADSISMASFYTECMDVDGHDAGKIVDVEKLRNEFVRDYKLENVNMATHPLMRRFCDTGFCDPNPQVEMAKVAAVSCIHSCIPKICGGDEKSGKGCRFDFPKRLLNHTVPAVMQVNATQMEARMLLRRTCDRVPNLNAYFLLYWRNNHDVTVLVDAAHKMRYATKYAAKSGKHSELLNEIIEYLSKRQTDLLPTSMQHVLSQLLLADVSHRAFMSKQELSYRVMDLPLVRRTFDAVKVVGFYKRSYLSISTGHNTSIVYSDRTAYSAYAERCNDSTLIAPARTANGLTKDRLKTMNLREFAETVTHEWQNKDSTAAAQPNDGRSTRRIKTRDVSSGQWVLKRRRKRLHIRFSTVLYTDAACRYEPVETDDTTTQTSFFALPVQKRRQLYRAYMELVCYVPWTVSPYETFLDETQRALLADSMTDSEKDQRYNLRRLEMFFEEYLRRWQRGEVAPAGSQWQRDNQYSLSMFLTMQHNTDMHMQRVQNSGMLKARYEPDDELRDTDVDLRYDLQDGTDQTEYPCALNFVGPEIVKDILEQKPPELSQISVAFPTQNNFQELEEMVKIDQSKFFMAHPPPCSVAYEDMTVVQQWAVDLGTDMEQKVLYLCGKAGSGKTQVALKICELLTGRVQAAAGTGKAASLLGAPTVHGMFRWGVYDKSEYDDPQPFSPKKMTELRAFYEHTDVFVVDEVNAMSAATLAHMHDTMTVLFNDRRRKGPDSNDLPFGGKKVIFLGDPAQLKPVAGEPIYGGGVPGQGQRARGCRGKLQAHYHMTVKGQQLYRSYLLTNCVLLHRGQRNAGLLQQICDRIRSGKQTADDLCKLMCRRRQFPDFVTDLTLHYDNESCSVSNVKQLWAQCRAESQRLCLCKASYHTTPNNHSVVDGLAALPSQKYNFASDLFCVSVGCQVRLIKNVNVSAGLVNSAVGKVVRVLYNNADCGDLLAGRHPPPYCIVVEFLGFSGFVDKKGERAHPFCNQPKWVPVYREKFVAARSELPSWIVKKQEVKDCWRMQFPLDLCRAMTCHRAQGQTLSNCTVAVDLGLDIPDRQLPQEITSILYVACTRLPRLQDLFLAPIFRDTWENIGNTPADTERRAVDEKLRKASLDFASKNGMFREMKAELNWEPDYGHCDEEWSQLQTALPPVSSVSTMANPVDASDFAVQTKSATFNMCLQAALSERHIGLDQGRRNFAIVAVDTEIGRPPVVVAAEVYDLELEGRMSAANVVLKLGEITDLRSWMQLTEQRVLPDVDRVVVHVEQMSTRNADWKHFGLELGRLLQRSVVDPSTCIVKMSQPHLLRAGGVISHLGESIVEELKLVPVTYGKKGTIVSVADSRPISGEPEGLSVAQSTASMQNSRSNRRVGYDDVEPSDSGSDSELQESDRVMYKRKKQMSASIFRYFVHATDEQQRDLGVGVSQQLQDVWQHRFANDPRVKCDDLGDALLHALQDNLCGGSSYRQLVPSSVSVHNNRTVVVAVCRDYTYWAVIHCAWNAFLVEDAGFYLTVLNSRYYNSPQTVLDIKRGLFDNIATAVTDMSGADLLRPVDVIRIVVKQLKAFKNFKGTHAGALTASTVTACKEICDEFAGTGSIASVTADKATGSVYTRTNTATSQKIQVLSTAGKLTNAILSCFSWMSTSAKAFVEERTFATNEATKLRFFNALHTVARSESDNLELIQLSACFKQKLSDDEQFSEDTHKKMLAYLILIGINKNSQYIKAVAANYRKTIMRHPKVKAAMPE